MVTNNDYNIIKDVQKYLNILHRCRVGMTTEQYSSRHNCLKITYASEKGLLYLYLGSHHGINPNSVQITPGAKGLPSTKAMGEGSRHGIPPMKI